MGRLSVARKEELYKRREYEKHEAFKEAMNRQNGIEATSSEAVRSCGDGGVGIKGRRTGLQLFDGDKDQTVGKSPPEGDKSAPDGGSGRRGLRKREQRAEKEGHYQFNKYGNAIKDVTNE